MKRTNPLIVAVLMLALFLSGCQGMTAPATYKIANRARLASVEPRLQKYAATQAADEQTAVSDLLKSWHIEVDAQGKNP